MRERRIPPSAPSPAATPTVAEGEDGFSALSTASGREGFSIGAVGNADWQPRKASAPGGSDSPP